MKKSVYILCILAVPIIIGILLYQRSTRPQKQIAPQNAQTIIPAAPQSPTQAENAPEDFSENMQSFITLLSDEILVDDIQADINGDNKEDKIIAAKKLSDQFIYLFLFLQDSETQTFTRAAEIKTEATHAKTLSFYSLTVREYPYPIIAYSGMNADALQVFGMYALEIDNNQIKNTVSLIILQADGQIVLKNNKDNSIAEYTVSAYYSDNDAPNTLNQIEKQYTWNEKRQRFEQTNEKKIPGKKVENQFLKTFQAGNIDAFQDFLEGLWYQPAAKKDQNRSIFFNRAENEIVFSLNNIQEIFTVDSISPRRFGVYFSTKNAAISSIHRRIDIELTGIDEITVRVIDDIARLKIGISSNWDGTYRKIKNSIRETKKDSAAENLKQILTAGEKIWTSAEGYSLSFSDVSYRLIRDTAQDTGWYTIIRIKENTLLQLKNKENESRFFNIIFDAADNRLILTEVSVTLNGIMPVGTALLIFE